MSDRDEYWMIQALTLAQQAKAIGEVPVGAVLVLNDELIGQGFNQPISSNDPTAHAEVVALRHAAQTVSNYRVPETTLYVTLEPCTMCVGALIHARIKRLVFGASEPKAGAVCSRFHLLDGENFNHTISYQQGVLAEQCGQLISEFFQYRREQKKTVLQPKS
ncbi:MAG: tRNA adenosine(34) deaminase TadA [Pseudomonadota bacterium]